MADKIHVAVRVRPLIGREIKDNAEVHWNVLDSCMIYNTSTPQTKFRFDRVFDPEEGNCIIYNELCNPIVLSLMEGFNGTIFAYGQTSSGKTYTMMGNSKDDGIIQSTIKGIFSAIENMPDREFLLRVSYMEIYNEMVADLLSLTSDKKNLKVQEDTDGSIFVAGLDEEVIATYEEVLNLMKKGERKRHIEETNMNERSSRSHTIFRMIVESRMRNIDEDSAINVSQLNLVDLAGSERAGQTGVTGERFKEGVSINKSLLMLSQVISQLSEGDGQYVSYRDSKLTRILQNSLGGNARTAIICTVTPASAEQTLSTIKFASRAKCIQNKPTVNEVLTDQALLNRYARELKKLQKLLEEQQQGIPSNETDIRAMKQELKEKEKKIEDLTQTLHVMKEKLIVSQRPPHMQTSLSKKSRRETWGGLSMKPKLFLETGRTFEQFPTLPVLLEESFSAPLSDPLQFEIKNSSSEDLGILKDDEFMKLHRFSFDKITWNAAVQTEHTMSPNSKTFQKVIDDVSEQLQKITSEKNKWKKEYQELLEFTTLERQMLSAESKLSEDFPDKQNQIDTLSHQLAEHKLSLKDLNSQMENLNSELSVASMSNEHLQILCNEKEEIVKKLSDKIKKIEEVSYNFCHDNWVQTNCLSFEDEEKLLEQEKEIVCLQDQLKEYEVHISEALTNSSNLNSKLMESLSANADLKFKYQEEKKLNGEHEQNIRDLKEKLCQISKINLQLSEGAIALQNRSSYEDEIKGKTFETDLKKITLKYNNLMKHIEEVISAKSKIEIDLSQLYENFQKDKLELSLLNEIITIQLSKKENEIKLLEEKLMKSEQKAYQQEIQINSLNVQLNEVSAIVSELKIQLQEAKDNVMRCSTVGGLKDDDLENQFNENHHRKENIISTLHDEIDVQVSYLKERFNSDLSDQVCEKTGEILFRSELLLHEKNSSCYNLDSSSSEQLHVQNHEISSLNNQLSRSQNCSNCILLESKFTEKFSMQNDEISFLHKQLQEYQMLSNCTDLESDFKENCVKNSEILPFLGKLQDPQSCSNCSSLEKANKFNNEFYFMSNDSCNNFSASNHEINVKINSKESEIPNLFDRDCDNCSNWADFNDELKKQLYKKDHTIMSLLSRMQQCNYCSNSWEFDCDNTVKFFQNDGGEQGYEKDSWKHWVFLNDMPSEFQECDFELFEKNIRHITDDDELVQAVSMQLARSFKKGGQSSIISLLKKFHGKQNEFETKLICESKRSLYLKLQLLKENQFEINKLLKHENEVLCHKMDILDKGYSIQQIKTVFDKNIRALSFEVEQDQRELEEKKVLPSEIKLFREGKHEILTTASHDEMNCLGRVNMGTDRIDHDLEERACADSIDIYQDECETGNAILQKESEFLNSKTSGGEKELRHMTAKHKDISNFKMDVKEKDYYAREMRVGLHEKEQPHTMINDVANELIEQNKTKCKIQAITKQLNNFNSNLRKGMDGKWNCIEEKKADAQENRNEFYVIKAKGDEFIIEKETKHKIHAASKNQQEDILNNLNKVIFEKNEMINQLKHDLEQKINEHSDIEHLCKKQFELDKGMIRDNDKLLSNFTILQGEKQYEIETRVEEHEVIVHDLEQDIVHDLKKDIARNASFVIGLKTDLEGKGDYVALKHILNESQQQEAIVLDASPFALKHQHNMLNSLNEVIAEKSESVVQLKCEVEDKVRKHSNTNYLYQQEQELEKKMPEEKDKVPSNLKKHLTEKQLEMNNIIKLNEDMISSLRNEIVVKDSYKEELDIHLGEKVNANTTMKDEAEGLNEQNESVSQFKHDLEVKSKECSEISHLYQEECELSKKMTEDRDKILLDFKVLQSEQQLETSSVIKHHEDKFNCLRNEIAVKDSYIEELKVDLENKERAYVAMKERWAEISSEKEVHTATIKQQDDAIRCANQVIAEENERVSQLKHDLEVKSKECSEISHLYEEECELSKKVTEDRDKLLSDFKVLQSEQQLETSSVIKHHEDKFNCLRNEIAVKDSYIEELKVDLENKERAYVAMKDRWAEISSEKEIHTATIKQQDDAIRCLNQVISEENERVSQLKHDLEVKSKECSEISHLYQGECELSKKMTEDRDKILSDFKVLQSEQQLETSSVIKHHEDKFNCLRNEIAVKDSYIEELKVDLENKERAYVAMKDRWAEISSEKEVHTATIKQQDDAIRCANQVIAEENERVCQLKHDLEVKSKECSEISHLYEEECELSKKVTEDRDKILSDFKVLQSEQQLETSSVIKRHEDKFNCLRNEIAVKDSYIEELKVDLENKERAYVAMKDRWAEISSEKEIHTATIKQQDDAIRCANQVIAEENERVCQLKHDLEVKSKECSEISHLYEEECELSKKVTEDRDKILSDFKVLQSEQQLETSSVIKRHEDKFNCLRNEIAVKDSYIEELKVDLENKERAYVAMKDRWAEISSEKEIHTATIKQQDDAIRCLNQVISEENERVSQLKHDLEVKSKECSEISHLYQGECELSKKMTEDRDKILSDFKVLQSEQQLETSSVIKHHEDKFNYLRNEIAVKDSYIEELKVDLENKERAYVTMKGRWDELSAEKKVHTATIKQMEDMICCLNHVIAEESERVSQLKHDLEVKSKVCSEIEDLYQEECELSKKVTEDRDKILSDYKILHSELMDRHNQVIFEKSETVVQLKNDLEAKIQDCTKMQHLYHEECELRRNITVDKEKALSDLSALQSEKQLELQNGVQQCEVMINSLKARLSEKDSYIKKVKVDQEEKERAYFSVKDEVNELIAKMRVAQEMHTSSIKQHEDKVKCLKKIITDKNQNISQLKHELEEKARICSDIEQLYQKECDLGRRVIQDREKLSDFKTMLMREKELEIQALVKQHENMVINLSRDLAERDIHIKELKTALENKENEYFTMKNKIDELSKKKETDLEIHNSAKVHENMISNLKKFLTGKDSYIEELEVKLAKEEKAHTTMKAKVAELSKQCEINQQNDLRQRNEMMKDIDSLKKSLNERIEEKKEKEALKTFYENEMNAKVTLSRKEYESYVRNWEAKISDEFKKLKTDRDEFKEKYRLLSIHMSHVHDNMQEKQKNQSNQAKTIVAASKIEVTYSRNEFANSDSEPFVIRDETRMPKEKWSAEQQSVKVTSKPALVSTCDVVKELQEENIKQKKYVKLVECAEILMQGEKGEQQRKLENFEAVKQELHETQKENKKLTRTIHMLEEKLILLQRPPKSRLPLSEVKPSEDLVESLQRNKQLMEQKILQRKVDSLKRELWHLQEQKENFSAPIQGGIMSDGKTESTVIQPVDTCGGSGMMTSVKVCILQAEVAKRDKQLLHLQKENARLTSYIASKRVPKRDQEINVPSKCILQPCSPKSKTRDETDVSDGFSKKAFPFQITDGDTAQTSSDLQNIKNSQKYENLDECRQQ